MTGDWKTRSFWSEHRPYVPGEPLDGDVRADGGVRAGAPSVMPPARRSVAPLMTAA